MKHIPIILALCACTAFAGPNDLSEQPLQDTKAAISLPEGWKTTRESEDGVFVFHFEPAAPPGKSPTLLTLTITTKVPDRTSQSPSAYAAALIDMSQDDGLPPVKSQIAGLPALRLEYPLDTGGEKMRAGNLAIANDKTGTLYFFTWQAPMDEPATSEALREKILSSLKADPAF